MLPVKCRTVKNQKECPWTGFLKDVEVNIDVGSLCRFYFWFVQFLLAHPRIVFFPRIHAVFN